MVCGLDFSCANAISGSSWLAMMVEQPSYFVRRTAIKIFLCEPMSDLDLVLHNHVATALQLMIVRPIFATNHAGGEP